MPGTGCWVFGIQWRVTAGVESGVSVTEEKQRVLVGRTVERIWRRRSSRVAWWRKRRFR